MSDIKRLGWTPDKNDPRDYTFSLKSMQAPQSVYLAHKYRFPLPYDQGNLGSCTAQAVAFLMHFNLLNSNFLTQRTGPWRPSRLFIYYYERELEGTLNIDAGAQLRSGIKVLADKGAPTEDLWTYDIPKFATQPSQKAIDYALQFQAVRYERIDNRNKTVLVNALMAGFPICFGMYIYYSFFSPEVEHTGIVPLPDFDKEFIVGGHAMVIVGYRAEDDSFIVRNSWGSNWGQGGYCRIPAVYLTNPTVAMDFWVVYLQE